jgi:hypothetical protein
MTTICWIKKIYSGWIDKEKIEESETFIELLPDAILKLSDYNEEEFILSYTRIDGALEYLRGDRYFEKLVIKRKDWVNAATIALDEYFVILNRVVNTNLSDNTSEVMIGYEKEWERIKILIHSEE